MRVAFMNSRQQPRRRACHDRDRDRDIAITIVVRLLGKKTNVQGKQLRELLMIM